MTMFLTHVFVTFLTYHSTFTIFFRRAIVATFSLGAGVSQTIPTFSSLLTPHRSIATSTVDRRFVVTLSRLFICGITNSFARFRRNNLRLWVFPTSNYGFCVKKMRKAFSAATSSKLYHITTGHLFVCRLQLYVRIIWSKVSTPALVPL